MLRAKVFEVALLCALTLGALAQGASAQNYPSHPIRLIVPFPAGGVTDVLARTASNHLASRLGQPVLVENVSGAAGNTGTDLVAKAPPDGHTLVIVASSQLVINPFIYSKMPFDALNDLAPVINLVEAATIVVIDAKLPPKTLQEFIAYAKTWPGELNYGSAGVGSTPHLTGDFLTRLAGIKMVHVPYRGIAPALNDLLGGQIQLLSLTLAAVKPQVDAGLLRALVVGARKRMTILPDVPTAAEAGVPDFEPRTWFGILAPAKTPPAVIATLNKTLQEMLEDPDVRRRFIEIGLDPVGGSPESFGAVIREDSRFWEQIVKASGAKAE
jgi:tripartite-type tricarboxylate transporter receptor subunit TctC